MRFFYVPNEHQLGDQVGPRKAFAQLQAAGVLSAYTAYSYLVERRHAPTQRVALERLLAAVEAFQPDVIFFQHLNDSYPVDRAYLQRLKAVASAPKFVWHDPDPYDRHIKPIDATMRAAIAECDMAIVVGLGDLAAGVRRAGAKRLLFSPQSVDDERFGQPWEPGLERHHDAVMIANLTCLKRVPFLFLPGGRKRKALARRFHGALGDRFAVYGAGQGWQGEPYCRGPIAYEYQERTMRSAWLSVNWGQFDRIPFYCSDRLPISLASGVPHITNHQPGYAHLFGDVPGLYVVHSPAEALDVATYLLSLPREQLVELGARGAAHVRQHFSATRVYADLVTAMHEQLFAADSRFAARASARGAKVHP